MRTFFVIIVIVIAGIVAYALLRVPTVITKHYDVSSFTQEEKNLFQATLVEILYKQRITYESIHCDNEGNCTIKNPSVKIKVTSADILAQEQKDAAARAAAQSL